MPVRLVDPRPGDRRRRNDRRRRGPPPAQRPELRGSRLRPSRAGRLIRESCEVHSGDLRDLNAAREAVSGCSHVIHLAAIVGGIANFQAAVHPHRGQQRADGRGRARLAGCRHRAACLRLLIDGVRERDRVSDDRGAHPRLPAPWSAYGFSKLAGEVYTRAAHAQHGLRYTICRPFNAYGPGELPDRDEPGIAHAVPDLIAKVLAGQRPLQIFGSGQQTRTLTHADDIADGVVTAMAAAAGEGEDFNISASQELTAAQIATLIWEACGEDPAELRFEHLPSFEIHVRRRWPSVEKARQLLGWEAKIDLRDGIRQTVAGCARRRLPLRGCEEIIWAFDGVWTHLGAPVSRQVPPVPASRDRLPRHAQPLVNPPTNSFTTPWDPPGNPTGKVFVAVDSNVVSPPEPAADPTAPGAKGLKTDAIGYISNLVISVASTAPAYSLAATLGFIVAVVGVGPHSPAVLIVSFIPILFVGRLPVPEPGRPRCRHHVRVGHAGVWSADRVGQRLGHIPGRHHRDGLAGRHREPIHVRSLERSSPHLGADRAP